jgi:hypothetical protein
MHRSQPNRLHDELDALLDGRPVELTDELAPLAEAADALRAELAAHQLDPEVANRHLEQILKGSATVVRMPVRPQPNGWELRRRVAAVVLAAALVLAPATMASAAALPGQAMYPFKLAIEQLRLASVQWSPGREAGERTRVADERLDEVQSLLELRMFNQLPEAIRALNKAVMDAKVAVREAQEDGATVSGVVARLDRVVATGGQVVQNVVAATASPLVGHDTADAIKDAVNQSPAVKPDPNGPAPSATPTPPATTPATPGTGSGPAPTTAPTSPPTTPTTDPPDPPPSGTPPTTAPPPTDPPPTTTPSPPTENTGTPGANGGGAVDQAGPFGQAPPEQAPETTLP